MESEKVKEIKESLQQEIHLTEYVDSAYAENVSLDLLKDVLTLINELESENERFIESCKNCHYIKDLEIANGHAQELKDRIAELEKGNTEQLKQFAEKVKNKLFEFFQDNEGLDGKISVGPLYVDVIGVEAKDGTIISLGLIDKLLKEHVKWHDMKVII